jgi:hypothetical protein
LVTIGRTVSAKIRPTIGNGQVEACTYSRSEKTKAPMTRETVYLVQAFTAGKKGSLKGDAPIPCRSAEGARRTAERLASSKVGVVAFSSSGDAEMGDYDDEPTIIFRIGRLPAAFD